MDTVNLFIAEIIISLTLSATTLLVLAVDGFVSSEDVLAHVRVSLMSALTGLVFGMIIVGKRIFSPAAQQCEKK